MERDRIKKAAVYIGVIAAVYLFFKYMLPLVAPFVLAFLAAAALNGQVRFFVKRLRFRRSLAAAVLVMLWSLVLCLVLWWAVGMLLEQIRNIINNYDIYYEYVNTTMCDFCDGVDKGLGLARGTTLAYLDEGIGTIAEKTRDGLMPSIMDGSITAIKKGILIFGTVVIFLMAVFFFTKDYDKMTEYADKSGFSEKFRFFYGRLMKILMTFIKTQGIVMSIIMAVCAGGLFLLKNPYWLLLGIVLGIVDALPVFGTGTILVPWAIFELIGGKYVYGAGLMAMCLASYLIRQYLEPKLMGKKLGIHPLYMLAAVYVGIMLFGVVGVITGPIAFLLAKECIFFYTNEQLKNDFNKEAE